MNAAPAAPAKTFAKSTGSQVIGWRDLPAAKRGEAPAPDRASIRPAVANDANTRGTAQPAEKSEHAMLFQEYFKSVGTRTYVTQVKVATNGNHYLVLTEANRPKGAEDVRKTRIFIYSEDFKAFFDLLASTQKFINSHPVPADVAGKQAAFWRRLKSKSSNSSGTPNPKA